MNDETLDILTKEVVLGDKAKKAYDFWLMHYLDTQYVLLFDEFKTTQIDNMPLIRYKLDALNEIEQAIKSQIDTGKMAKQQLGE